MTGGRAPDAANSSRPAGPRGFLLLLVAAVAVAAVLRFHGLGSKSPWLDECFTRELATMRFGAFLERVLSGSEKNPPLYFALLSLWVRAFGDSAWALRLPSALFGVLSVPVFWRIGVRVGGRSVGLLAAIFLAVSVFHVQYAQEARAYSLMVLLALSSWLLLLRGIEGGRRADWALWVACCDLLTLTHVYGYFVIAAEGAFAVARLTVHAGGRRFGREWIVATGALVLLCLPGVALAVRKAGEVGRDFWIPEPGLRSLAKTGVLFSGSVPLLALFAIAAVPAFLFLRAKREGGAHAGRDGTASPRAAVTLSVLWLSAPVLLPFALSFVVAPIYWPKYAIAASPAWYLLAALGLARLPARRAVPFVAALPIVFLSALALAGWYRSPGWEPWRDVVAQIEAEARPGDVVLIDKWEVGRLCFLPMWSRDDVEVGSAAEWTADGSGHPPAAGSRVWLVLSHSGRDGEAALARLEARADLRSTAKYPGIRVHVFESSERAEARDAERR